MCDRTHPNRHLLADNKRADLCNTPCHYNGVGWPASALLSRQCGRTLLELSGGQFSLLGPHHEQHLCQMPLCCIALQQLKSISGWRTYQSTCSNYCWNTSEVGFGHPTHAAVWLL